MIHYIVGKNLGHLNPCVANISKFRNISSEEVKIFAYSHTHEWLKSNLTDTEIHDAVHFRKGADQLLNADLLIHDWRDEVKETKNQRKGQGPIIGGIYHSDLSVSDDDTDWTTKFKQQIRAVSQRSTDIFFHINLTQPKEIPELTTLYMPIPIIARDINMQQAQVKSRLGIPADEPFILVQMGGGIGKFRYRYMDEWYEKINQLEIQYRIVVAGQLGGVNFPFNPKIVQAPLFENGRELVNAADLVISKPGMGILMDCISTGTPLLSLPADTKEREVKNMMLKELAGEESCVAEHDMPLLELAARIKQMISQKDHYNQAFSKVPQNGAEIVAQSMKMLSGKTLVDLPDIYEQILKLTPFRVK
ncbi:glycosyltransferase [Peribacillus glennii]|uniref:glycosyltransferase n=1 Tax=Peribacillus glennii TaxID=2303991 RepID=UPI001314F89C|nr:glycosyltransferase [Peribacillus glennii]